MDLEELDRLSYTRRYFSLVVGGVSQRVGDVTITNGPVCMCDRVHRDDGKGVGLEV